MASVMGTMVREAAAALGRTPPPIPVPETFALFNMAAE